MASKYTTSSGRVSRPPKIYGAEQPAEPGSSSQTPRPPRAKRITEQPDTQATLTSGEAGATMAQSAETELSVILEREEEDQSLQTQEDQRIEEVLNLDVSKAASEASEDDLAHLRSTERLYESLTDASASGVSESILAEASAIIRAETTSGARPGGTVSHVSIRSPEWMKQWELRLNENRREWEASRDRLAKRQAEYEQEMERTMTRRRTLASILGVSMDAAPTRRREGVLRNNGNTSLADQRNSVREPAHNPQILVPNSPPRLESLQGPEAEDPTGRAEPPDT